MLSDKTVQEVKAYSDIVTLISDYVSLKKRGRNYIGLCPFHSEKSPSFTVSPEKKIFHCFGCHESGDHISFIQKIDNLSFVEAIRHIAQRVGIEVEERELSAADQARISEHDRLGKALFSLREAYESYLPDSEAYRYLSGRGVSDECMKVFHLGASPSSFDTLDFLSGQGLNKEDIKKTGVVYQTDDGRLGSRFRNRVIFPVMDHQGRTVGFGGRILDPNSKMAKYMNSDETLLFNKRRILYGLSQSKADIRKKESVIIMEGYMDVIMAHQYGFQNAVGCLGTAITSAHAQILKRFTSIVYLAMDSDEAGQRAIDRSFEVLREHDFKVFVVRMDDKDPADVLQHYGAEHFQDLIAHAQSIVEFKLSRILKTRENLRIEDIPEILSELIPLLKAEKDAVIVRHYVRLISQRLKVDEELIMAKLKKSRYNVRDRLAVSSVSKKSKTTKAEEGLVYLTASHLPLREVVFSEIDLDLIQTPELNRLAALIKNSSLVDKQLIDSIKDETLRTELSRILMMGEVQDVIHQDHVGDYMNTLQACQVQKRIDGLKTQIKALEAQGEDEKAEALMQELQTLIQKT